MAKEVAASEESPQEKTPEKKKGGMMKIIMLVGIIAAVGGGGFFAYTTFIAPPPADEEENGENIDPGEVIYDPKNPPGVIKFTSSIIVRLKKPSGIMGGDTYLKCNMILEVINATIQAKMEEDEAVMGRIKDTILTFFSSRLPRDVENARWESLKEDLRLSINSQFPENYHILKISFTEFLVQPK